MAEFLVRAAPHWMDSLSVEQIPDFEQYKARTEIGDIIVAKPDGWPWGKEECLPTFLILKVPGLSLQEGIDYAEPLLADAMVLGKITKIVVRRRKYRIPIELLQNAISKGESILSLSKSILTANLVTKIS